MITVLHTLFTASVDYVDSQRALHVTLAGDLSRHRAKETEAVSRF